MVGKQCLDQKAVSHTASAAQRLHKSPTKVTYFLQQDLPPMRATAFPKNATRWGPNVQIHKVMGKAQMINTHFKYVLYNSYIHTNSKSILYN